MYQCVSRPLMHLGKIYFPGLKGINQLCGSKLCFGTLWSQVALQIPQRQGTVSMKGWDLVPKPAPNTPVPAGSQFCQTGDMHSCNIWTGPYWLEYQSRTRVKKGRGTEMGAGDRWESQSQIRLQSQGEISSVLVMQIPFRHWSFYGN